MRDRLPRASIVFGFILCLAAVRPARAETDVPEGGAPGAAPAKPEEVTPAPAEGGGLFEQSAAAAEAGKAEGAPPAAPPFTLNGYIRGDVFIGKVPDQNAAMIQADYGELSLQLRTAKSAYGDGFAEARIRYGLQGPTRQTVVDLREAYVNTYLGPVDLRLGQQIVVWGRADALNPTSNITPVDFRIRSPLEDDIRIGNIGARAFLRFSPFRLEGVWMPAYLPTELPNIKLPQFVSFGAPTFPTTDLRNSLVAGRLHLELAAIEMSVSYLHGFAPLPGLALSSITLTGTTDPPPSVLISRTAYQQQVIGFDFSTALGDVVTLRGEAAYRLPYDYKKHTYAARPDVQYAIGADHNFGSLSVIAQYMGRYVFDWQKEPGTLMDPSVLGGLTMDQIDLATNSVNAELAQTNQILFSQTAQVQHLATLRFEYLALHETLSISALGLVNITTHEYAAMPRIGYKFSDAMIGYLGAQIFRGPNDTLFGLIKNDLTAAYVELRYTF